MSKIVFLYLIVINIATFFIFAYDKFRAKINASRISEKRLYMFSFFGGLVGAIFSMVIFRHKIMKKSFMLRFYFIILFWIIWGVVYFLYINPLNFVR